MADASADGKVLRDKRVAFTGRLASMTRSEAAELVRAFGGEFAPFPTRRTSFLVVGQEGWPLGEDGRLTAKLRKAQTLQTRGYGIALLAEEDFLGRLGLSERQENVHRRYTTAQLARILDVPGNRLRMWQRAGWIRPVETVHRLCYFDFAQVAAARSIIKLTQAGIRPEQIRRSLEQIKASLPGLDQSLAQLSLVEQNHKLLVRLQGGELAEPSGQLRFDFDDVPGPKPVSVLPQAERSFDDWYEAATEAEDVGRLADACAAYREALLVGGPDAECCFNLANVLHALGHSEQAVERYRQAVELDGAYVEAWNNLGNVLSDLGQHEEGIAAFERALRVAPGYADAHYNLAETLAQSGRVGEARRHWEEYLKRDPQSGWSAEVRSRLSRSDDRQSVES